VIDRRTCRAAAREYRAEWDNHGIILGAKGAQGELGNTISCIWVHAVHNMLWVNVSARDPKFQVRILAPQPDHKICSQS
jgi:hypothetical protein